MGNAQAVSDYRRRRKANLVKVCGNKCNICGYNKIPDALEFHHINPEEKTYSISANGTCHDLDKDLAEVKKCILVCANCHREIHANIYSQEDLLNYKIYDEQMAQELKEKKQQLNEKTNYYCKQCGKQLYEKTITGLCFDCYNQSKRIVKNRPSREELKILIQTIPFTKIGEQYGVSDNAIRKWCKVEKLPSTKAEINAIQDWEKI